MRSFDLMKRVWLVATIWACTVVASYAQITITGAANSTAPTAAVAYSGPADIVASPSECYWLAACSNALANAGATTTGVVDVRGATTGTSCTIYLLGNGTGNLDLTTAGAGAVGHQCLLGATTFCTSTNASCTVSKIYGQINGHNLAQATTASQPTFTFNCVNTSLPCLTYVAGQALFGTGTAANIPQPYTIMFAADPTTIAPTGDTPVFTSPTNSYEGIQFNDAGPVLKIYSGSSVTRPVTVGSWHVLQGIYSGTSSIANVDNTCTPCSTGNAGTINFEAGASHPWYFGEDTASQSYVGKMFGAIIWPIAATTTQQTNVCHNVFTNVGTGTSC